MAENDRLLIDSSYLVALFNSEDRLHAQAVALNASLGLDSRSLVISNFIFLEVVTVLAQRVNRATAGIVGKGMLENPDIQIIHVDEALQDATWEIFREIQSKNTSFVDCSTVAIMRAEDISDLLTFDATDFKRLAQIYHFHLVKTDSSW